MSNWIEVDRAGLAQVIADRPKSFLLFELIQNALDENVTNVSVLIERHPSTARAHKITVTDDSPDGYQDIRHAWTLYAPSKKKADAELRGRFNVGCKMVLALAVEARVVSTKAAVEFTKDGRRTLRRRTECGTIFEGTFRMTLVEAEAMQIAAATIIPPPGVTITIDGPLGISEIEQRDPFATTEDYSLPTIRSDEEGILRTTKRKTRVELHETLDGETPTLYEMGIPVVELDGDDPYHVDVMQRVPLNIDRDNVTPSFLRTLRVIVLNTAHDRLDKDQAQAVWATEASEDERADDEAVDTVLTQRFGERRVAYDPSDPEANMLATSKGYAVVHGGSLTAGQWQNAKGGGSILPAGQVTPSPTIEVAPDGVPPIDLDAWTDDLHGVADVARKLAHRLVKIPPSHLCVLWYDEGGLPFSGAWMGKGGRRATLSLNRAHLTHALAQWRQGKFVKIVELLIHEFAHHAESNHLAEAYHDELCRLGAECLTINLAELT